MHTDTAMKALSRALAGVGEAPVRHLERSTITLNWRRPMTAAERRALPRTRGTFPIDVACGRVPA